MSGKLSRRELLKMMGMSAAAGVSLGLPHMLGQRGLARVMAQNGCEITWARTYPEATKFDPPLQISVPFWAFDLNWLGDDDRFNNPEYNLLRDRLGIEYVPHWEAAGETRDQLFATDIASGDLADMFAQDGEILSLLIENDAVADITDIWEATASDLVKEKKGYPDADMWVSSTRDGRIYGIAFTYGAGYNVDNLGWIRQDWLDQLNLSAPTTVDELTTTVRAFKEAGLCDYGINACQRLVTWYNSMDPIFGAFGTMPTYWLENEDGTLRYGSIDPAVKDALAVLREWYAEGLMDPDFFTYGEGDAAANIAAERVGVWFAPWWGSNRLQVAEATGGQVEYLPAPIGPNGLVGRKASDTRGAAVCFRSDIDEQKIVAAIQELNWRMEMHVNWEQYNHYGAYSNDATLAQGYDWDFDENCNVIAGESPGTTNLSLNEVGFHFPWICYPAYQFDALGVLDWTERDPAELNGLQQYIVSQEATIQSQRDYLLAFETRDQAMTNRWLGTTTEDMTRLVPDLRTMEETTFIEIIVGNTSLDAFDDFVEAWRSEGGDTVTEQVNAWKATVS